MKYTHAEQVEIGSSVHLTFERFDSYVESELSRTFSSALVDRNDRKQGRGRGNPDLTWHGTGRRPDVDQPLQEVVASALPLVDGVALVVTEWDGGEHTRQIVLGLQ